ncbi:MAG: hypothetical protein OER85_03215 [Gammaproteobacteria bacterium]|nr:hypothetical protein [Gammaproteobacteria bacterium]
MSINFWYPAIDSERMLELQEADTLATASPGRRESGPRVLNTARPGPAHGIAAAPGAAARPR